MTSFLPKSVQPSPPETMPPRWLPGSSSAVLSPSRAPLTAVIDAAGRPAVDDDVERARGGAGGAGQSEKER